MDSRDGISIRSYQLSLWLLRHRKRWGRRDHGGSHNYDSLSSRLLKFNFQFTEQTAKTAERRKVFVFGIESILNFLLAPLSGLCG